MGKPFKVHEIPAKNTNEMRPATSAPAGKAIIHSQRTGDPLPAGSQDVPEHEPLIPWPPAGGPDDRKPMKLNK